MRRVFQCRILLEYEQWIQDNTFALNESNESVAMNPAPSSDAEFLAPYGEDIGVDADILAQLKPQNN